MTIVPEGNQTRINWVAGGPSTRAGISYLSSGSRWLPNQHVEASLREFVELVLTRLDEVGLSKTQLREEWDAVRSLHGDEASFAEAAARLGLDPFQVPEDVEEAIVGAADSLPTGVVDDFFDAVDPAFLRETLSWVSEASAFIETVARPAERNNSALRSAVGKETSAIGGPWISGYARARAVRRVLGLELTDPFPVGDFVSSAVHSTGRREFDGYGRVGDGIRLVRGREVSAASERFAAARALWRGLSDNPQASFLLTRARTATQKRERAFAAELLAPASGIGVLLGGVGPLWDDQDIADLAAHFGVHSLVVERQIDNNRP